MSLTSVFIMNRRVDSEFSDICLIFLPTANRSLLGNRWNLALFNRESLGIVSFFH